MTWKPVNNYEGYYEINEYGDVRSLDRYITKSNGVTQLRRSKMMSQNKDRDGYMTVKLSKDGKSARISVARLVAFAFVDGYQDGFEPNHIDCVRTNNYYKNLEWVSHADNVAYTKQLKRHVSDRDISGANNPNFGNDTLKRRFENEPELRMKQSRRGAQNGMSKRIRMYLGDDSIDFDYIGQCAQYLIDNNYTKSKSVGSIATYIRMAAENNKKYLGIRFELI